MTKNDKWPLLGGLSLVIAGEEPSVVLGGSDRVPSARADLLAGWRLAQNR